MTTHVVFDPNDGETERGDASWYWFFLSQPEFEEMATDHLDTCDDHKPARCMECYGLYRRGTLDWNGNILKPFW